MAGKIPWNEHFFYCILSSEIGLLNEILHLQANVGREKDFLVALRRLRGKDADITREAAEIEVYTSLRIFPDLNLFLWYESV